MKAAFLAAVILLASCAPAWAVDTDFHSGDDPVVVSRIVGAVTRLAVDYPELRSVTVGSEPMEGNVYAQADGRRITFNTRYTTNRRLLESMVTQNSRDGFHPALGHCSPEELLAFHEAAHVIDVHRGRGPSTAVAALHGLKGLSGYSYLDRQVNSPEALAEGFASVLCNGGSDSDRRIYELVNQ